MTRFGNQDDTLIPKIPVQIFEILDSRFRGNDRSMGNLRTALSLSASDKSHRWI